MFMESPISQRREGQIDMAPRITGFNGKTIGLLHNGKHGGEEILLGIKVGLKERHAGASFDYRRKPHAASPASFLGDIVADWDAAVVAVGDCGSCSSWSVFDSIELEKSGIPVVLVVTRPFVAMNQIEAKRLLHAKLPMLVVDHPLAHLPADELMAKGARLVEDIETLLTGGQATIANAPARPQLVAAE